MVPSDAFYGFFLIGGGILFTGLTYMRPPAEGFARHTRSIATSQFARMNADAHSKAINIVDCRLMMRVSLGSFPLPSS